MRQLFPILCTTVLCFAAAAQERSGPKKTPTFPEAVEQAKKAVEADKLGAAIAALQAAIRDLQKKQRAAVLACLPKPEGWTVEDDAVDENSEAIAAGIAAAGMTMRRRYQKGEQSIAVEVTANSPLMGMLTMMFDNPTLVEASGGELVKYGAHKAILKKSGDSGQELQLLMHGTHLIKIDAQGVTADDLLKVFDQAFVDRLEKPLGK
ncbi:MAG: hypothetical protein WAT39_19430 [Planctomycetota bacterium]